MSPIAGGGIFPAIDYYGYNKDETIIIIIILFNLELYRTFYTAALR